MNVKGIIAISGRPGLFKVVAQGKNSVIVESMLDGKRTPAYASEKISTVEDISIFTEEDDVKLVEVFATMKEKYGENPAISHKSMVGDLETELSEFLPNYDKERVYLSDIRKIFQWYNLLHKAGLLDAEATVEEGEASNVTIPSTETVAAKPAKVEKPKASAKPASAKKVVAPKTGSSRGK
ncbi:MAG: hypothetical protein RL264_2270 [Bacteroidota bacterium]|jgi:hypothetical protein